MQPVYCAKPTVPISGPYYTFWRRSGWRQVQPFWGPYDDFLAHAGGAPQPLPLCRSRLRLSPSWPSADAPCPHCGSLVWFPAAHTPGVIAGPATGPAFTLEDYRKQLGQVKW